MNFKFDKKFWIALITTLLIIVLFGWEIIYTVIMGTLAGQSKLELIVGFLIGLIVCASFLFFIIYTFINSIIYSSKKWFK